MRGQANTSLPYIVGRIIVVGAALVVLVYVSTQVASGASKSRSHTTLGNLQDRINNVCETGSGAEMQVELNPGSKIIVEGRRLVLKRGDRKSSGGGSSSQTVKRVECGASQKVTLDKNSLTIQIKKTGNGFAIEE